MPTRSLNSPPGREDSPGRLYRPATRHSGAPLLGAVLAVVLFGACAGTPPNARRAETLIAQGQFAEAEAIADQELGRTPKHPTYWRLKIRAALGQKNASKAVTAYQDWRVARGGHDSTALKIMALTTLWQGLRVPSVDIRVGAIAAIERHKIERLADAVGELLADDDDVVAASASIAVLRGHPQAARIAGELLHSDVARARAIIVAGLGQKVGSAARDDLVAAMADRDAGVRRAAVSAIGSFKDPGDVQTFIALAGSDPDGATRATALRALVGRSLPAVIDRAATSLADDYLGARLAAIEVLGKARATAPLANAAAADDLFVALRAAIALGKDGAPVAAVPGLIERALKDEAWSVRAAAINALDKLLSAQSAMQRLRAMGTDPREEVRQAAARVLALLGAKDEARPQFLAGLRSQSEDIRLDAAIDLARLGDAPSETAAESTLDALMKSANPTVRVRAAAAHLYVGRPTDGLVAALADEAPAVRLAAADILYELALLD